VERSESESRSLPASWERRIRFYAVEYSHWRRRRWFTRPVTYASNRAQVLFCMMNQHGSDETIVHAGLVPPAAEAKKEIEDAFKNLRG
jgi:hypothetical protein